MKIVLFSSTGDSGRPSMAAAIFNSLCAPSLVRAVVNEPGKALQPEVIAALKEIGIEPPDTKALTLRPELGEINVLVSFGGAAADKHLQGVRREEWAVPDPAGLSLEQVRRIREQVSKKVWRLIAKEGWYRLQPVASLRFRPAAFGTIGAGAAAQPS